jgi:hypothetical protein
MSRLQGKYLATGAVDARVLATDAVETAKIKNAAVTAEKLADSCISAMSKIDSAILNVANGLVKLDGSSKIPVTLLPNAILEYKGIFTPGTTVLKDYADGATAAEHIGDVYRASAAGEHDFGPSTPRLVTFEIGDYAICNENGVWERADTSDAVVSVNGKQGVVTLGTDDVAEGSTNKYFTDARAKSAAVSDAIVDGVTDVAPSQNAVYDALALKASASALSDLEGRVTTAEVDIDDLQTAVANAAAKSALHTLTSGEITAKSFDLPTSPLNTAYGAIYLCPVNGIPQVHSVDFTVSGAAISWNGLGMDELTLVAGDQIKVIYY